MKKCRDCDLEFDIKTSKKGFSNQCDDCSEEQDEPPRYLGYNDGSLNKASNTSIYRGDDPETRRRIKHQKSRV